MSKALNALQASNAKRFLNEHPNFIFKSVFLFISCIYAAVRGTN